MVEARVQQEIVVHADDRVGVLADITRVLSDMGINLLSVFVHADGEAAAVHLVTTSQTYAAEALQDAGFDVSRRDAIVLDLPHHPGFLCRVTEALARKEIAIDEMYATASEDSTSAIVVLTTSHNSKAVQVLRGH